MIPVIKGKVIDGKFLPDNEKLLIYQMKSLEGKEVDLIVKKHVKTRSLNQNRLYWHFLSLIEEETGNGANEMHQYFKRVLLKPVFIKVFDKEIKIPASTRELDTKEFTDYIARIEEITGIACPNPLEIDI